MSLKLTNRALDVSKQVNIKLNLVLKIEGVADLYGAIPIKKFVQIGDTDLEIGDPETNSNAFYIGGFNLIEDQESFISFDGSSTKITQQVLTDKGEGSSISSFAISLIDQNEEITRLITPDDSVSPTFDILGAKCKLLLGFDDTAYPEDYITIFRGEISDVKSFSGRVLFQLNHPDEKKRSTIYKQTSAELDGALNNSDTTITVDATTNFLVEINGPSGVPDGIFESYIRIDDELIKYAGTTATTFTGCTRGQFNTAAVTHDDGAEVNSIVRFKDENPMILALKLMLSGFDGPFIEDQALNNFNIISSTETISNSIFFSGINVADEYGITEGDYITTTGASDGANNVTLKQILTITQISSGSYIVITGVTFVDELDSAAVIDFRSQYDTLPDGMKLRGDETDIAEHLRLRNIFLSSPQYDFLETETIEAKVFLDEQIYLPMACFSLPRKSQASVGIHSGPIPGQGIVTINNTNVVNPKQIKIRRSISKNYYNEILYSFEKDSLEDRFLGGIVKISATSKNQITNTNKTLEIPSRGLRNALQGASVANVQAQRFLDRYEFAAESFGIQVLFKIGITIEVGDIVLFDGTNLQISDITNASRVFEPRLMEVINKSLDIKTGDIRLSLVDTNFDAQGRYALISPSSVIKAGLSTSSFIIQSSFASQFGPNEFRKWEAFTSPSVKIRNSDFSRNDSTKIVGISGNSISVSPALSFTPSINDVMEFSNYDDSVNPPTAEQKLIYAWMQNNATFPDGEDQYIQL